MKKPGGKPGFFPCLSLKPAPSRRLSCDSDESILDGKNGAVLPTPVNIDRVGPIFLAQPPFSSNKAGNQGALVAPRTTVTMRCGCSLRAKAARTSAAVTLRTWAVQVSR